MRRSPIYALLLAASCSPPGGDNDTAAAGASPAGPIVVTAASREGRDCSYRWNDEAVSAQKILDKSVVAIQFAIDDVGGIENLTETAMPLVHLEGAGNVPYACTGPVLRQFERSGLVAVVLKPDGAAGQSATFFQEPYSSGGPFAVIRLNAGGMSWDDRTIDKNGLSERARAESLNRPPVELVVAPAEDSSFLALHDALAAIRQGGMDAILSGCSGTTGPIREPDPVC